MQKKVSVIIPCRNEKKYISRCLDSILNNKYESIEIIVVDGASEDGTREILESYQQRYNNIRIFTNTRKITPVSMNIGVKNATGDYIMIAGAHSSFPPGYISGLINFLGEHPDAAGAGGIMKTVSEDSSASQHIQKVLSDNFGVGNSLFRIGSRVSVKVDTLPYGIYHKSVFNKAGLYNERLIRNQDIEWSKRVLKTAGNLYLVPSVKCYYYFRSNFIHLARSGFKNGCWNVLTTYITKNVASLSLRHFIPLVFILGIVLPLMAAIVLPAFAWLAIVVFVVYFILMLWRSLYLSGRRLETPLILWSFIVLHFSYGTGSLVGLFSVKHLFKNNKPSKVKAE
ncbi:MAG: glycosyltransferase family 2 protein [Bacteroidales bacterium]